MNKFWLILFFCQFLASCGSFGESFLAGLTNMVGGYGVYGVGIGATAYTNTSYTTGGNINQLLDPNLAVQQVLAQEDQDYQAFCRFNKKADGSNYSKTEWRIMQGQAIQNANGGGSSYSSSSSSDISGGSCSSSYSNRCKKTSVMDIAHCEGTGVCQGCNGNKRYWDSTFGNGHWVDPCVTCNGTCKCPSCNGTGYK